MKSIAELRQVVRTYSGDDFVSRFTTLCQECEQELGILSFAIILYDETTPEFRKVLADRFYWEALDAASGDRLVVFALADRLAPHSEAAGFEYLVRAPASAGGMSANYSAWIRRALGQDLPLAFPAVLFFQTKNAEIHECRLFTLDRQTVEVSARALQDLLTAIGQVLKNIARENFGNREEVFQLVVNELKRRAFVGAVVKGYHTIKEVLPFLKFP